MNKEEAIKYLQQLYPNGGHCWLDEQRIEAIGMAVKALQEEPESIWHDANEKSDNPEDIVIINPSDNTGAVLTKCISVYQGRIWAYTSVLLNLDNSCNFGKNLQEEPEREDLVECTSEIILEGTNFNKSWYAHPELAFKAGTKWQKTKDESTTEDLGDYINELSKQFPEVSFAKLSRIAVRVAKWQAEQMMAKAIDGKVIANGMGNPILHLWDKGRHFIGKKVKVIVIEEQL